MDSLKSIPRTPSLPLALGWRAQLNLNDVELGLIVRLVIWFGTNDLTNNCDQDHAHNNKEWNVSKQFKHFLLWCELASIFGG